ncbi:hypothetical protein DFQ27_007110 [Actinomortierella ambigua]|uniref:Uncharacterized protein n=1 Tax=Actinomortierella ambigua TaxID=1343610 RepID=A0A9P6U045_9FUNG|nr:hypothetical protein DFQ27_007110 [Actinomortierella ambigua]
MATVTSRFDSHPSQSASTLHDSIVATTSTDDNPWIATYSKGLCSLYPREDDGCFDVLLATQQQQSNVYARQNPHPYATPDKHQTRPDLLRQRTAPATTSSSSSSYSPSYLRRAETEQLPHPLVAQSTETQTTTNVTYATNTQRHSFTLESFLSESTSFPLSPARAIAGWGFNCIDYFTRTRDDDLADEIDDTPSHSQFCDVAAIEGTRVLDDCRPDFAAVCGKRSAALTRKRVLSRSQSQVSMTDDPWLEAIDRLSRWDEVAYR